MNIDERLEALTQSVELLASMQRDHERTTDARFAEIAARFADLHDFINSLAHIAEAHDKRIRRLEGNGEEEQ